MTGIGTRIGTGQLMGQGYKRERDIEISWGRGMKRDRDKERVK